MKKITYSLLILVMAISSACDKVVTDVEVPRVEAQMVLFGFISPEENTIRVELTLSKPIFGNTSGNALNPFEPIKDANVVITNEAGQAVTLNYADSSKAYVVSQSVYKIEAGRTYTITAVSPTKSVKAVCTVPSDTVSLKELTALRIGSPSSNSSGPYFKFVCKWDDPAQKGNYYRLAIQQIYFGPSSGDANDICNNFLDDETKNGQQFTTTCEDYNYQSNDNYRDVYLLNTDVHYYEYMRRRVNYFGDDPFSEPFPQYSNVQNGLGVFCSFRKTKRSLTIKG